MGRILKLKSDLQGLIKEMDQVELLTESNTTLQWVIKATYKITIPFDVTDPVEKIKWCATYLNDCQAANV